MWELTGSNRRPSACKADALNQTELNSLSERRRKDTTFSFPSDVFLIFFFKIFIYLILNILKLKSNTEIDVLRLLSLFVFEEILERIAIIGAENNKTELEI